MFLRKNFPKGFYIEETRKPIFQEARNIFRAASYCLVKIISDASCRTILTTEKCFLATFFRPFWKAVATPFLVMLYLSGDSTNLNGSGYEIRY